MSALWLKRRCDFWDTPHVAQLAARFGALGGALIDVIQCFAKEQAAPGFRVHSSTFAIAKALGELDSIDRVRECLAAAVALGALTEFEELGPDEFTCLILGFADEQARAANVERQTRHREKRLTPTNGASRSVTKSDPEEIRERPEPPLNGPDGADILAPPPSGARARDTQAYAKRLDGFAEEHFPGVHPGYVEDARSHCEHNGKPATAENMAAYIALYSTPTEAAV